jgi:hypothetical protein
LRGSEFNGAGSRGTFCKKSEIASLSSRPRLPLEGRGALNGGGADMMTFIAALDLLVQIDASFLVVAVWILGRETCIEELQHPLVYPIVT